MSLNLSQKADICAKLDKGIIGNHLANEYNVSKSTISRIKNHKNSIMKDLVSPYNTQKCIRLSKSNRSILEQALYEWVLKQHADNVSLSNKILKDKAKQIYYNIYTTDEFRPGDKWLRNFKQRYNLQLKPHLYGSDKETTSLNISKSMKELEFTPSISKIDENFKEMSENLNYNSDLELDTNKQTISNQSHEYNDRTCSENSELSEGNINNQSVENEREQNSPYSNEGSELAYKNMSDAYGIIPNHNVMSESRGNEMNKSVDVHNSSNQSTNSEGEFCSDESESRDESELDADSVCETSSDEDYGDGDDDEDDPNVLCDKLSFLITSNFADKSNADPDIKIIVSKLRDGGFIY